MSLPVGIHDGVSMNDYMLHHGLSSSRCTTILQYSPFHAYHGMESEPSEASETGTAIHDGLLEGIDRIVAIEADDWRTKAAKEAREAARAEHKIPMLARKVAQIMAAIDAAKRYVASSEISGVFDDGKPEQTVIWKEGEMICKARPDWLTTDRSILLHVKTTAGSANPDAWIRNQLTSCGYDVAAMFYARGLGNLLWDVARARDDAAGKAIMDKLKETLSVFLVIEQNPPYGCSLVGLSPAMQDLASRKVDRAIRTWQRCKKTGKYPAYPSRIAYADPKPWELAEEETQEFTEAEMEGGIPL